MTKTSSTSDPPTAETPASSSGERSKSPLWWLLCLLALAIVVVVVGLYLNYGNEWWHPITAPKEGHDPDATALISTLIFIYTFFIGAYGGLTPSILKARCHPAVRTAAILLMLGAISLDLGRVSNSTGDLYTTTTRNLSSARINDAAVEFTRYFLVNVIVILILIMVACWPGGAIALRGRRPTSEQASPSLSAATSVDPL